MMGTADERDYGRKRVLLASLDAEIRIFVRSRFLSRFELRVFRTIGMVRID